MGPSGEVTRYESRFERWRPERDRGAWREELAADDGGGVLLDLGVHLVDQASELLGPVTHVYAEVAARRGGSDDDVFVALGHRSGAQSHLWASAVAPRPGRACACSGARRDTSSSTSTAKRTRCAPEGVPTSPDSVWCRPSAGGGSCAATPGSRCRASGDGGRRSTRAWCGRCATAIDPPSTPATPLVTLEVLEAARRSAAEGAVVATAPGRAP